MDYGSLWVYALTIMALAIKPGPGIVAVVSKTAARGVAGFLSYMSGALLGEIIYLGIVVYGFSHLPTDFVFISLLLKSLTAAYLIYMGVRTLQVNSDGISGPDKSIESTSNRDDFTTGLMLTLSNPLVIVVFAGIVPSVINVEHVRPQDFVILAAVTVISQIPMDFLYCAPVLWSRKFFNKVTINRLRIASGITILLVGLYIGYTALPAHDLLSVSG